MKGSLLMKLLAGLLVVFFGCFVWWNLVSSRVDHFIFGAENISQRFVEAKTAEEQMECARDLNKRFHWYFVRAYDDENQKIDFHKSGEFEKVKWIELEFTNSRKTKVRFVLLDRRALTLICGE